MKKNNSTCCLIFTRTPEPGKTKTRLIPSIGIDAAYKVHLKLLKFTFELTAFVKEIDFELHTTSINNNSWLSSIATQYKLNTFLQTGDDLGARMYNAISTNLKNYSQCILIGSDCPELSKSYLLEAQQYLLSGFDVVIGPAADGGYVLIGMSKACQCIFDNINWGENTVCSETIKAIDKLSLSYKKLTVLHDVDTAEDLHYLNFMSDTN